MAIRSQQSDESCTPCTAPEVEGGGNGQSVQSYIAQSTAPRKSVPAIEAKNVTVSYEGRPVLRSVTFSISPNTVTGIIGPNGAGKSTLLKAMLGLIPYDHGCVEINGQPISKHRNRIAYVPQTEAVDWDFPVTVFDVVLMGRYAHLGWFRRPGKIDRQRALQALERVGMEDFARRHIRNLSGGQQQRVFIARALCQEAEILLLDEPFAGVDVRTEEAIFELISNLTKNEKTLLVVNHDLSVLEKFDYLLMLNQRVVAFGPTSEVATEVNLRRTYGGRSLLLDKADSALHKERIRDDPDVSSSTRV